MLTYFFVILALVVLKFITIYKGYRPACRAIEVAISNASDVYYPGRSN